MFSKTIFFIAALAVAAVNGQGTSTASTAVTAPTATGTPVPSGTPPVPSGTPPVSSGVSPSGTATAPTPSGTAGIPSCILQCVTKAAAANNCTSIADIPCVCQNAQFQADAGLCLTTNCTPGDQATAQTLQTSQCSAAGLTPTGPVSPTPRPVSFTSGAATGTASRNGTLGVTGTTGKVTPTASQASGTGLQAGSGVFLGAVLAGIIAL